MEKGKIKITQKDWNAYEKVRATGVTNMADTLRVRELTKLSKAKVNYITENYMQKNLKIVLTVKDFVRRPAHMVFLPVLYSR